MLATASCTRYAPLERSTAPVAEPAATAASAPTRPKEVVVRRGDTLGGIAAANGIGLGDMISVNPDLNPDRIRPGQKVRLPPPEEPMQAAPPLSAAEIARTERAAQTKPPSLSGDGFLTPVRGTIVSTFGDKPNGTRNDGVNISAAAGTPVLAAENGVVIYAGDRIPGLGRMILMRHAQGYTTLYAHAQSLLRELGDVVERGQKIATVGATGQVRSPQLHFELREGRVAIDPTPWLEAAPTKVASGG